VSVFSGRDGEVWWDATGVGTGATLKQVASLDNFKVSFKTNKIDVTVFGVSNKLYVPGLRDVDGTVAGFWDSDETALWDATLANSPGYLKLIPNNNEPLFYFAGKSYLDASMDCAVEGAPKVTSTIIAASAWTGPKQTTLMVAEAVGGGGGSSKADRLAALRAEIAALERAA